MTASTTRRTTGLRSRTAAVGAIAVAGALLLTACGDQTDKGSGSDDASSTASAPLADKLPADIRKAGVIKVGSDIAYPPVEYMEGGKAVGIDPDIAEALGKQLGVRFEFQNGKFAQLIVGLQANRFNVIMSAMNDTKDRQNGVDSDTGKKVGNGIDFVDYFTAGTSILVQKGNPKGIKSLDDLCGQVVALQVGTTSEGIAKAQSKKCEEDGKKAIKLQTFDTDPEALLRLKQGASVADLNDFPVAAYNAKTSGGGKDFEVVGEQIEAGPYGIGVSKENTELRDAIQAAMSAIIENGEYEKILQKWNVTDGAVTEAKINGGS
ncbi:ABC transporter substrate-binding protein [Streptomyces ipomoeae]|jgi:polar amino acid transport system substrate-binding protein|uniref:ABC transporter, substrate-binding protein, family 3 n=2 Tax=Streptomyces ipomoeae TaxID=103232 RepID=L1KZQ6_9ACTN|nr:ABC transporter substrate-binding protein [Streptomyces ipomoeae]EKX65818.1 ABC transporter, substrate-binding protein, family 3 [Streptomyces ipomoeae 91-03]MDX2693742.1 ABC transporter substrate-binding protein [Streptomyces ipomoeae]MDX2821426.1 ABC transporter substrate-binding protein [Streptomyces ipomoeae]MDX2839591.1 ABC transporter substrate-binding protein [Streptomyces ipomoeae]MDX2874160.1 ABC transporter substrate-binding protein [Streptomyces ipomoeae]